jgi:hypothetical protein
LIALGFRIGRIFEPGSGLSYDSYEFSFLVFLGIG